MNATTKDHFLAQFSKGERERLYSLGHKHLFKAGDIILQEGGRNTPLCVVLEGCVSIEKREKKQQGWDIFRLSELGEGEIFGEISFVENSSRTATVVAQNEVSILEIPREPFLTDPSLASLYQRLLKVVLPISTTRLRKLDQIIVENLRRRFSHLKEQKLFGSFFLLVIEVIAIYVTIDAVSSQLDLTVEQSYLMGNIRVAILGGVVFLFAIKHNYPFKEAGFTLDHWFLNILQGVGFGIALSVFVIVFYLFKWDFDYQGMYNNVKALLTNYTFVFFYPIHSFIQEAMVRGVLQFSLQKFLKDTKGYTTLFVSSVLFAAVHTSYDISLILVIFLGNFLLGSIYNYKKNLILMTSVHVVLGFIALGLAKLESY